jgi:NTP pyrophosphatase (non-canonical NTP hydrolase)
MKTLTQVYKEIREASDLAKKVKPNEQTLENKVLKLMEESGELATDTIKLNGYKVSKQSREEIEENMKEEIVDVLLVILDIAHQRNMSEKEISHLMKMKLIKWLDKHILES